MANICHRSTGRKTKRFILLSNIYWGLTTIWESRTLTTCAPAPPVSQELLLAMTPAGRTLSPALSTGTTKCPLLTLDWTSTSQDIEKAQVLGEWRHLTDLQGRQDHPAAGGPHQPHPHLHQGGRQVHQGDRVSWDRLNAMEWVQSSVESGRRYFLYLGYHHPHHPQFSGRRTVRSQENYSVPRSVLL